MKRRILYIALLLTLLCPLAGKAQLIAVKTDGLKWALMTPNVGLELVIGERTSLDFSLYGTNNPWGKDVKMFAFQPEFRYWFNGRPMVREYIGVGLLAETHDITWGRHIYKGDALGAGLTFGYVFDLTKRLNLELYAGFGAVAYFQKEYYINDNYEDYENGAGSKNNSTGYILVPTKLGVAVSYILK